MKVLVDAQKKLNIPLSNKDNELLGDQLLLFDNTASLNNTTFPQFKVCTRGHAITIRVSLLISVDAAPAVVRQGDPEGV